jgi:hypothetical protein
MQGTTIVEAEVRENERNDDDGGIAHKVHLEDLPLPQTPVKPADISLRGCSGAG